MRFNEDSRVKIPAILHLARLGYTYLSLKNLDWHESSNIVPTIFKSSVAAINPGATPQEIENALTQTNITLAIEVGNVLRFHADYFKPEMKNRPKSGAFINK